MAKRYSLLDRIPWEQAYTGFLALEQRKQWLVMGAVAFGLCLLIFAPMTCASHKLGKLEKEYLNSQKNLRALAEKVEENTALQAELKAIEGSLNKNQGASLATVLEGLANEIGISKNINSLKPRKIASGDLFEVQGLDVRVSQVPLNAVIDYLAKIEGSTRVKMKVSKLQMKPRYSNRSELDVTFQVSSLVPKAGASSAAEEEAL